MICASSVPLNLAKALSSTTTESKQLDSQCFLVNWLEKATAKLPVHFHCGAYDCVSTRIGLCEALIIFPLS